MKNANRTLAVAAMLAVIALISIALYARPTMIAKHPQLPVDFVHADHTSVGCVDCHHNYADDTGQGLCFACHKNDFAIQKDMQQMFHDLCRGCHVREAAEGEQAGPVRVCVQCHHPNDAFM